MNKLARKNELLHAFDLDESFTRKPGSEHHSVEASPVLCVVLCCVACVVCESCEVSGVQHTPKMYL